MEEIRKLSELLGGSWSLANWPRWLLALLLLVVVIGFIWKQLSEPIKSLLKLLAYFKMSPADRDRIRQRQRFASTVATSLRGQDAAASWDARRFTELEAEYYAGLEATGPRWRRWLIPVALGPRRIKALSRALTATRDPFAQLEGAPGSGKSVVLRRVAAAICDDASVSWKSDTPVALYMNLKGLDRPARTSIDAALIRGFVVAQFKKLNNAELDRYVDTEFDAGMREGRWLFLFDSFDEIPEVLSAEDASETPEAYAKAIFEFATTFSACRTVLATRYFRRPQQSALPKYRVLPLTDAQRETLIERANLTPAATQRLYDGISRADASLRSLVENPMYLGLLIEYVRSGDQVPTNPHQLFARYVDTKFDANADVLRSRYGTDPKRLREFSELIAFTIVADAALGLNPRRADLVAAARRVGLTDDDPARLLDALEHLQFARGEAESGQREQNRFTFSHRRFQEYFTTSYVLRVPDAVSEHDLLMDARWRETTVVLLSTATTATSGPMLAEITQSLAGIVTALETAGVRHRDDHAALVEREPDVFPWPPMSLHILGLVQDAFADDPERLPESLRMTIATIMRSAFAYGRLADRRVALEVAGTLRDDDLLPLLRAAIQFGSQILDDAAFRQARRITTVPADLSRWIRLTLLERAASGRLRRERRILLAFLSRVRDGGALHDTANLLSTIRQVDFGLHVVLGLTLIILPGIPTAPRVGLLAIITFSVVVGRLCWFLYGWGLRRQRVPRPHTIGLRSWQTINTAEFMQLFGASFLIGFLVYRSMIAPAAIATVEEPWWWSPSWLSSDWRWMAAAFLTMWTPMAVAAAATGMLTARRWWPWLTLFPMLAMLRHPLRVMHGLGWLLKRFWIFLAIVVVFGGGAILGVGQITKAAPNVALFILTGMFGVTALTMLIGAARWLADWHRLRQFRLAEGPLPFNEFRDTLDAYFSNPARVRFIRLVAARSAIRPTPDALTSIRTLSLRLERDLRRRSANPSFARTYVWKAVFGGRLPGQVVLWDHSVLDELSRLELRVMESLPTSANQPSKR